MKQQIILLALLCTCFATSSCKVSTVAKERVSPRDVRKPKSIAPRGVLLQLPKQIKGMRTMSLDAHMWYDTSLAGVKARADAIVTGRMTQDFLDREHRTVYFDTEDGGPNELVQNRWTRGTFVVDQVLYKKAGINLTPGRPISLAEPVGLDYELSTGMAIRSVREDCYELKQNTRYVVAIGRADNGTYGTDNYNLGRFNTDGTDLEDELGNANGIYPNGEKTPKQKLREELTAAYGVYFTVPDKTLPEISNLIPNYAAPNGSAFTLTVNGSGFQNGAVIMFGKTEKQTTFLSETQLSARILASDLTVAGNMPIRVKNPDNKMGIRWRFHIANIVLSPVNVSWAGLSDNGITYVAIGISDTQSDEAIIQLEKQDAVGNWSYVAQGHANAYYRGGGRVCRLIIETPSSVLPLGTKIRVRAVLGQQSTTYSPTLTVTPLAGQNTSEDCGDFFWIDGSY